MITNKEYLQIEEQIKGNQTYKITLDLNDVYPSFSKNYNKIYILIGKIININYNFNTYCVDICLIKLIKDCDIAITHFTLPGCNTTKIIRVNYDWVKETIFMTKEEVGVYLI